MSTPITLCTIADFHQILTNFDQFWDREAVGALHHLMFVREFGDTAFVIHEDEADGVRGVKAYGGIGQDRVVMLREL